MDVPAQLHNAILLQSWRAPVFVCEKIHLVLHSEIMQWGNGNLINSGEAAEGTHNFNVKGPGVNLNHCNSDGYTLLAHSRRKETV